MGMKIVSIGGGTGLSTLLRGLKQYVPPIGCIETGLDNWIDQLTAVVTVTDDGGSSGQLRRELHVLPPGDIRNCMVALAEDEALMTQLFKYRFSGDGNLQGHSFGNLFLSAMTAVVGDFLEAIRLASEVLAIRGCIYPSTVDDVTLVAELADGRVLQGETTIVAARAQIKKLWLAPIQPRALPEAIDAIYDADIITVGPGSLYTSILPNLLVPGIAAAIAASRASKIFVCNVMTQPGETEQYSVEDHLRTILHFAPHIHFDHMLINNRELTPEQRDHYAAKGSYPVEVANNLPIEILMGPQGRTTTIHYCDLLDDSNPVRHHSHKLAAMIKEIAQPKVARLAA